MQLLALTHQNAAANNGTQHWHQVMSRSPLQQPSQLHSHVSTEASNDASARGDREAASLLDTPAPRKRPPVPTQYAANHPHPSYHNIKTSSTQSGLQYRFVCSINAYNSQSYFVQVSS